MSQPLYTAEILVEFVDAQGVGRDFDRDVVAALSKAEAEALVAERVTAWGSLGYHVRSGSGWATGTSADVKARVLVEQEPAVAIPFGEAVRRADDDRAERVGQLVTLYLDFLAENQAPDLAPWLRESNGIVLIGIRQDLRDAGVDTGFLFDWSGRRG